MSIEPIDVVVSFDTTGSMYPCLTQVRRNVEELCKDLFSKIPGLRIGIIAHGDYCDHKSSYVTEMIDLTDNQKNICKFIRQVDSTGGGDAPECYELVMLEARTQMSWKSGKSKVVIMIGDATPHPVHYDRHMCGWDGPSNIDWRNEMGLLLEAGINVYAVHAMPDCRQYSRDFYQEIARETGGFYIPLDQFSLVRDMIMAVSLKQQGAEELAEFERQIEAAGKLDYSMDQVFVSITGREAKIEAPQRPSYSSRSYSSRSSDSRKSSAAKHSKDFGDKVGKLEYVPSGRFQVMEVDDDCAIKEFVQEQGLAFEKGKGFYEFSDRTSKKPVKIQAYKEIVLRRKSTGEFFTGNKARKMVGLPIGEDAKLKPADMRGYVAYVQSTSYNRKLFGGSNFLYEVPDWDEVPEEELATT
jgi:hypothetical protein